jgi:hypothetical protein
MTPHPRPGDEQGPGVSGRPIDGRLEARDQISRLRKEGGTYRSNAAGLATAAVHDLAAGRRNPAPATDRALRKAAAGVLPRARLDAGCTRLRLRALHVMGHGSARIARALGVGEMTIRRLTRGDAPTVNLSLRDDVTDLYDAWGDKSAPERNKSERAAVTAARRRAIAGNWCAGAGLDDDELDTPGYKPTSNWKPATGTGTAPDIHPPDRPRNSRGRKKAAQGMAAGGRPWR